LAGAHASGTARAETVTGRTTRSTSELLASDTNNLVLEASKSVPIGNRVDSSIAGQGRSEGGQLRNVDTRADTNRDDGGTDALECISVGNEVGTITVW